MHMHQLYDKVGSLLLAQQVSFSISIQETTHINLVPRYSLLVQIHIDLGTLVRGQKAWKISLHNHYTIVAQPTQLALFPG